MIKQEYIDKLATIQGFSVSELLFGEQIENNEAGRLSHHAGTKMVHFKDPRPFFAMLRLFCLALTVFNAFFCILQRNETASKALMQRCKFTCKSAFSQEKWHYKDAFEYLLTAGI